MLMSADAYRESLRAYSPRVYCNGEAVASVADEERFLPGIRAVGVTYDYALKDEYRSLMLETQATTGKTVNRMVHINRHTEDLLSKLEAVRLICRESGCAQRYLTHDALNAIHQATFRMDGEDGTDYHPRFLEYLHDIQERDLTLGVAMTDAKGNRALKPQDQANPDSYVHIKERRADGIVISGTKAIVTGGPYMHELLVMPCRTMPEGAEDFAVCCAVPIDAGGLTIIARPAGRPGNPAAKFTAKYGQSTAVCIFEDVFVPWDRVFMAGEPQHTEYLVTNYANHHRHSCIAARAGFGDLLIGAGALMVDANGLDAGKHGHIRETMVELIKIVEGFFACGVAASVYGIEDPSGAWMPEPVFANIGKLLLATPIYDMHRTAHTVSGGLIVALPGPDEDHNPATAGDLATMLRAREDVPYQQRIDVARFVEDITASDQGGWYSVISLHGGGSPEAMKREIFRRYPIEERKALVERLLDRGVAETHESGAPARSKQPGQCCPVGCQAPDLPREAAANKRKAG
ncbi:MAG: 4-hydroxyphenylacetate 3-hydroxylase N-terminal domain-containing protein [Pseudomonadota bacterium]